MKKILTILAILVMVVASDAQTVLTVSKETKKVTAEQSGSFDYVKDEWKLLGGNSYLLCMPAALDGYYFGRGAGKKVVKFETIDANLYTYSITVDNMAEDEDFKPNATYLVTTPDEVDGIFHITPGIKTVAVATPENTELRNAFVSPFSEITTGINSIMGDDDVNKPATIYDLEGRCVNTIRKGATYIINGKKVLIK